MEFLVISKGCLNTLMEQLFLCFFTELFVSATTPVVFPTRAALYLKGSELIIVKSPLSNGTSSLLTYHKLPDVSE